MAYSRSVVAGLMERIEGRSRGGCEERVRRAVAREALKPDPFTRRAVQRHVQGSHGLSAADFARAFDALERAGEIRRVPSDGKVALYVAEA